MSKKLEVDFHTSHKRAALSQTSQVYTLSDDVACHGKLGVCASVLGEREHVVGLNPELQTLYVFRFER